MYRKLESVGSRLLGMLVPKIEASAACNCWPECYQCAGAKCCVESRTGRLRCGMTHC